MIRVLLEFQNKVKLKILSSLDSNGVPSVILDWFMAGTHITAYWHPKGARICGQNYVCISASRECSEPNLKAVDTLLLIAERVS